MMLLTPGVSVLHAAHASSVRALLHFNGADASTAFDDAMGNVWTRTGTPTISTAQSKFGGASGLFAAGQCIQCGEAQRLDLWNQSFCVQGWARQTTSSGNGTLIDFGGSNSSTRKAWAVYCNFANRSIAVLNEVSDTNAILSANNAIPAASGSWWHWCVEYDDVTATTKLYVDGVEVGSATNFTPNHTDSSGVRIGLNATATAGWVGNIDEVCIEQRRQYGAAFTPPAAAFDFT